MAKSPKPRNKKYRPKYTTFATPFSNRPLTEHEIQHMRESIEQAILKIQLSSRDRLATDTLATYMGYGYLIAGNFEQSDELKDRFKKGMQALHRARWAIDLKEDVTKEDLATIEEVAHYAADEVATLDLFTLRRLDEYFHKHAQKLFDIALEEIGGNKVMVMTEEEYQHMVAEGLIPEGVGVRKRVKNSDTADAAS